MTALNNKEAKVLMYYSANKDLTTLSTLSNLSKMEVKELIKSDRFLKAYREFRILNLRNLGNIHTTVSNTLIGILEIDYTKFFNEDTGKFRSISEWTIDMKTTCKPIYKKDRNGIFEIVDIEFPDKIKIMDMLNKMTGNYKLDDLPDNTKGLGRDTKDMLVDKILENMDKHNTPKKTVNREL